MVSVIIALVEIASEVVASAQVLPYSPATLIMPTYGPYDHAFVAIVEMLQVDYSDHLRCRRDLLQVLVLQVFTELVVVLLFIVLEVLAVQILTLPLLFIQYIYASAQAQLIERTHLE